MYIYIYIYRVNPNSPTLYPLGIFQDLRLALSAAADSSTPVPSAEHALRVYNVSAASGFADRDFGVCAYHVHSCIYIVYVCIYMGLPLTLYICIYKYTYT